LQRLIVRDVLPPLGMRWEHAHDREAELAQVVREREAIIPCELDADEDVGGARPRNLLTDEGHGLLEARARRREGAWLGIRPPRGAHDEGVSELAGIDADAGGGALRALALGEGDHGRPRGLKEPRG